MRTHVDEQRSCNYTLWVQVQHQRDNMPNDIRQLRTILFNHMDLQLQVPQRSHYKPCTIKFLLTHQPILQLMIKRCIQRLQRSIPIKRFKFFNTRECSVDNVIQLIQCRVRAWCHLNVKELFISGSVHIIVLPWALFGILYFSQRYVIRATMRPDGIDLL